MLNINIPNTSNTQSISNLVFYVDTVTDSIGDFFTLVLTNSTTQKTQIINFDASDPVIIERNTRFIQLRLTVAGPDLSVSPESGAVNLLAPAGNWTYQLWQSSASLLCLDPSCSYDFDTPEEWLQYRQDWSGGILSAQKDDGQAFLIQNDPSAREIVYTPYQAGNEDLQSIVYVQPGIGITAGIIYGGGRVYDIQGGTAYVVALSDLGTYPFGCAPTVINFTGDVNDLQRTQSIADACPYDGTAAVAALSAETGGLTDWSLGSSGDFARIVTNGYGPAVGLVAGKEYWVNQDFPYNGQTNNIRRSYQLDNTTYWSRVNGRTNLIPNDNTWTVPSIVTLTNVSDTVPGTPITTVERFEKTGSTGGTEYIQQVIIAAVPSGGTTYSLSRYFKVGNTAGSTVQTSLEFNTSGNWGGTSWIQLINLNANGTVTLGTSTNCVSTVTNVGSGWYRVALTFYMGSSAPSGTNANVLLRVTTAQPTGTFFFTAGGLFENSGEISPWVDSGLVSTYNSIVTPDGTDPFYTNFTSSLGSTGSWVTGGNWNTLALRQTVGSLPLSTNTPFVVLAKKPAGSGLNYVKVEANNSTDANMWITVDLRDGTHTVAAQPQTNLILQSENFSSGSWAKTNVNVRSSASLSPGGNLAHYVIKPAAGITRVKQSINGSPGSQYWVSVWGKAGNSPNMYCLISNSAEAVISEFGLNLNTGTFSGALGSYVTQRQTVAYQNGWRRIDLRCTIPAGQSTLQVNFSPGETDAAGSFIFLWGCSVTQTTAATPPDYIPTTTTALTRSGYTHNVVPSSNGYYWIILRRTSTSSVTMNCTVTPLSTPEGDSALTGNPADKILIGGCGLSVVPQVPFPATFDFPATYPAGAWDAITRDDLHLHLMPKNTNLPVRLFREFEI